MHFDGSAADSLAIAERTEDGNDTTTMMIIGYKNDTKVYLAIT